MTEANEANGGAEALRKFVERIERLEGEKTAIAEDIKEVKKEAEAAGFDMKVLNETLRRRRKRAALTETEWRDFEQLREFYEDVLGMPMESRDGC